MNGLRVLLLQQQRPKYDLGVRFIIFSLVGGILLAGGRWEGWWRLATRLHFYFWSICMQFPLFSLLIIFHFTPLDPFGLVFFFQFFQSAAAILIVHFANFNPKFSTSEWRWKLLTQMKRQFLTASPTFWNATLCFYYKFFLTILLAPL